jgi:hypothetical protein
MSIIKLENGFSFEFPKKRTVTDFSKQCLDTSPLLSNYWGNSKDMRIILRPDGQLHMVCETEKDRRTQYFVNEVDDSL